jgi:hypothetical protein
MSYPFISYRNEKQMPKMPETGSRFWVLGSKVHRFRVHGLKIL